MAERAAPWALRQEPCMRLWPGCTSAGLGWGPWVGGPPLGSVSEVSGELILVLAVQAASVV